ncbi:MAG: hypothetical protein SGARI_001043 [Bacillariaceae sp.]
MSLAAQHPSLILLQSTVANGFYNLDSTRFQKATLDERSEGWTETWGGKQEAQKEEIRARNSAMNNPSLQNKSDTTVLVFEDTTNAMWVEVDPQSNYYNPNNNSISIVLTQFRPAWLEQMVLKISNIPYIVVNSTHDADTAAADEDGASDQGSVETPRKSNTTRTNADSPLLSPSTAIYGNSILAYLQDCRGVNLDRDAKLTEVQKGLSHCFLQMVTSELSPILHFLRYEDRDAWEQVYRRQYIQATCPRAHYKRQQKESSEDQVHINWFLQLRGRFQAMMERSVERKRLIEFSRRGQRSAAVCIPEAVDRARKSYQALERQLMAVGFGDNNNKTGRKTYLLGTDRPALVDAALWAHLADALCDVHLVVVLASFPNLVQYFQDMYQTFFDPASKKKKAPKSGVCWEAWNQKQNLENAFQQIPILARNQMAKFGGFKDAVDLMQNLSLQKQDLQEVLAAVKAKRDDEPWPKPRKSADSILYRWCMGEDIDKSATTDKKEKEHDNPIRQKMMQDQKRNDQRWISGVGAMSLVAVLLLQAGAAATAASEE